MSSHLDCLWSNSCEEALKYLRSPCVVNIKRKGAKGDEELCGKKSSNNTNNYEGGGGVQILGGEEKRKGGKKTLGGGGGGGGGKE